jgi:hypothetical protein
MLELQLRKLLELRRKLLLRQMLLLVLELLLELLLVQMLELELLRKLLEMLLLLFAASQCDCQHGNEQEIFSCLYFLKNIKKQIKIMR